MLVLSRKAGESIVIGETVVVTILQIGPGRVQVGVTAPSETTIHRQEIHDRIQAQERQAAGVGLCLTAALVG